MNTINKQLSKLRACEAAREWAGNKSWKEIFETCHRGDWLLWLFKRTNPDDLQRLTLAKAHCANTVRHLMKDERSKKAVDVAISFGEGVATREELNAAYASAAYASASAAAAYASAAYAYASAAYASAAAAYASAAATDAADATASAAAADATASAAAAYAAYAAASADARTKNQMLTADACRKYLPIEIWNVEFD